ncbi:MAG: hypothetical protein LBJ70_00975 [Holosporales bacterium]|nr:hypothetical protein [Holosporales bacterium]
MARSRWDCRQDSWQSCQHNPKIRVVIHWLQYQFNLDETDAARRFFSGLVSEGLCFREYRAYLNDLQGHLSYCRSGGKEIEGYSLEGTKKDIDFERVERICANSPPGFSCGMKGPSFLVITEEGQLAQCCMVTSKHAEYRLGDILTMSKKEIARRKKSCALSLCKECEECGFAYFFAGGNECEALTQDPPAA